jgi:hypothetical protein
MTDPCQSMAAHGATWKVLVPDGMAFIRIRFAGGNAERPRSGRLLERNQAEHGRTNIIA